MNVRDLQIQYEACHKGHAGCNRCGHAQEPSLAEKLYFEEQERKTLLALKERLAKEKIYGSFSEEK